MPRASAHDRARRRGRAGRRSAQRPAPASRETASSASLRRSRNTSSVFRAALQRSGRSGISTAGGSLQGVESFRRLARIHDLLGCRHRSRDGVQRDRVPISLLSAEMTQLQSSSMLHSDIAASPCFTVSRTLQTLRIIAAPVALILQSGEFINRTETSTARAMARLYVDSMYASSSVQYFSQSFRNFGFWRHVHNVFSATFSPLRNVRRAMARGQEPRGKFLLWMQFSGIRLNRFIIISHRNPHTVK